MTEAVEYDVKDIPMVHLLDRTRYVSNPDNILGPGTVFAIDSMLYSLEEKTGIQTLVVVVTGIKGGDCFEFAHRLGDEFGVGEKKRDNGLVVLLSTDERCIQFATGYGLEGVLPDAICKRIQQKYMVERFGRGDWDSGMLEGMRAVCGYLDGSMEKESEEEDLMPLWVFLATIILGAAVLAVIFWYQSLCPKCRKNRIQRVNSRIVERSNGYITRETTFRCLNCGHIFTRRSSSVDTNYRGPRGGGMVIGTGGFGRGGFSGGGGSFGGGRFGGGGAGSRF